MQVSKDGMAAYSVLYMDLPVIENSSLGIIREDGDYYAGLKLDSVSEILTIRDDYSLLHGKKKEAPLHSQQAYLPPFQRLRRADGCDFPGV